jgi:hypothetical protein
LGDQQQEEKEDETSEDEEIEEGVRRMFLLDLLMRFYH